MGDFSMLGYFNKAQLDFWEHLGRWFKKGPAFFFFSFLFSALFLIFGWAVWRIRIKCKPKGVIHLTLLRLTNSTLICIMSPFLSLLRSRQSLNSFLTEKHSISMPIPTIRHCCFSVQLNLCELCWHTAYRIKYITFGLKTGFIGLKIWL